MKQMGNFIRQLSAGVAFAAAIVVAAPSMAATGTAQAPTGFFVPTDAQKNDAPYYRYGSDDWGWTHGGIAAGFTSASLNVSAFDVDSGPDVSDETDNIYALDGATWVLLGKLTGSNQTWAYANAFTLSSDFFDDIVTGLQVKIDIAANGYGWAVTLGKSVLTTDGSVLPPPLPGVPEPSSWAMMIAGFGLVGAMARRRKSVAVAA